jgi:para-aminobenzoate synthetase component I
VIIKSFLLQQNSALFKEQMLNWSKQFSICSLFDTQQYQHAYQSIDCLMAVGSVDSLILNDVDYTALKEFISTKNRWLFGHISFEFQHLIPTADAAKKDSIGFPLLHLFEPAITIQILNNKVIISSNTISPELVFNEIINTTIDASHQPVKSLVSTTSKDEYLLIINSLLDHIHKGDCYEINFCQEFHCTATDFSPYTTYLKLAEVSPTPFSCFYKMEDKYLLCASPERFLKKKGKQIIAQPIKGTIARDLKDAEKDNQLKQELFKSEKDRSENVMIVDLMRNDLSRIAKEGTVEVTELFGIYSFPHVHQMISTIEGQLEEGLDFSDVLKATFPMGSMTGAPKKRVLELIDKYEPVKRGLYSGTVGYITPEGDFDFNVVIRSILHNETNKEVSYQVGSGITFYSNAEKEYEECLLKATGMQKALT